MEVRTTMAGSVWKITAEIGQTVAAGDSVVILESMKMEIPVAVEQDGVVKEIKVQEGDFVNDGDLIAIIETAN